MRAPPAPDAQAAGIRTSRKLQVTEYKLTRHDKGDYRQGAVCQQEGVTVAGQASQNEEPRDRRRRGPTGASGAAEPGSLPSVTLDQQTASPCNLIESMMLKSNRVQTGRPATPGAQMAHGTAAQPESDRPRCEKDASQEAFSGANPTTATT